MSPCKGNITMEFKRLLVDKKGLRELGIPYSFTHIQRLERAGLFPLRKQLGACRVAWDYAEILEWVKSRPSATTLINPNVGGPF